MQLPVLGVGEMFVSAIVELVIGKLASAVGGQLNMIWNFDNDLEKMKETLKWLDAVLRDAERRSITEETVKLWLKELKKAANEISDMLDDFRDEVCMYV